MREMGESEYIMTNTIINAILANRGFTNKKVDSKIIDVETVREWHALLDELHSVAYEEMSARYNKSMDSHENLTTNVSLKFYDTMRKIYAYIGSINGATLKCDANVASIILSKSVCEKTRKSADLQYVLSQKSNSVKYLNELKSANGANPSTVEKIENDIVEFDEKIAELKTVAFSQYKAFHKTTSASFYKAVEDYIADMLEKRLCMTEAEVRAEAEAKRAERRAKTAQKKAQKNSAK